MLSFRRKVPVVPPAVLAAQRAEVDERTKQRQAAIGSVEKIRRDLRRTEAELHMKAAPIEKRLAALRAETLDLESQLEPLARQRLHAMGTADREVSDLVDELKADATTEVRKFQHAIEDTRENIRNGQRYSDVFRSGESMRQERVTAALAATLEAYREADRIAREVADVPAAVERVRENLRAAGIELLDK